MPAIFVRKATIGKVFVKASFIQLPGELPSLGGVCPKLVILPSQSEKQTESHLLESFVFG